MSQGRYESHKYARLNTQEELNQQRLYSDNDDDNEEIELGAEQCLQYQTNIEGTNDNNSGGGLNMSCDVNQGNSACSDGLRTNTLTSRLKNSRFMQMAIGSLATILLYLTLSIFLTFYQKALIRELKFPLSIVCYHLVLKLLLASCVRTFYRCYSGKSRIQLDWHLSVRKIAPTGLASGIDIGFSNWGLELVPISLYTMTKSSTIVFILFFAILLGLEKKSWSLVSIVSLIAVGLFMFTYKSTQFDALGFIFILVASLSGGIRWTLAQFVMQKSKLGLHNPIDMIYHMQPWMVFALIPFLVTFEGEQLLHVLANLTANTKTKIYMNVFKISAGAFLAFCMEVSEFLVLAKTSSLTLSIAGIFKDIFQLALAVELNGDQLTIINVLGLIVCLVGIGCHLLHKYSTLSETVEPHNYNENNTAPTDVLYNEISNSRNSSTNNNNSNGSGGGNATVNTDNDSFGVNFTNKTYSSQTVPLLYVTDDSEDDFSSNGVNNQNSSEIIFDILKRRDMSPR